MKKKNESFLISCERIITLLPYDYVNCNGLDTSQHVLDLYVSVNLDNDNFEIDRHDLTINNL